ncbi:leucine-rich repeat-containing protein 15 [Culicoides brevitarsis]|uniref:leucine-rich repeat-containing protein 15 n=1 Tax=Culicoides brevitarsis TaxID=469753 RepID=UPI00307CBB46
MSIKSIFFLFLIPSGLLSLPLYNPLPKILLNPRDCPLNACEVIKIFAEHLFNAKIFEAINKNQNRFQPATRIDASTEDLLNVQQWERQRELETRLLEVERRLRSVEQPIWKINSASVDAWDRCTEGICRCHATIKSLSCWRSDLLHLPPLQVIPMNMMKIDLSANRLSTLNKDSFKRLTHLVELDISSNQLDYLPFDVFEDQDSLEILRLQKNKIELFDYRLFLKLRNLVILDASDNQIHSLPENLFDSIRKVTAINLSHNKIENFPSNLLRESTDLEEFDISKNKIKELKATTFDRLTKLRHLILSENQIEKIDEEVFHHQISLEKLVLYGNRLKFIPDKLFVNLTSLLKLDLHRNLISKISSNAFLALTKLEDLNLGQNNLATLAEGLFLAMKCLKKLTLFSNNFTRLEKNAFNGLENVSNLLLNNNNLKDFDNEVFVPLKNLAKLRLDSNKLMFLPSKSLDHNPKLLSVKLGKNPWHCDCRAIYLARWLRVNGTKLWDGEPTCRGPGELSGQSLITLRFIHICEGQWAAMVSLSPRLPIRKQSITGQFEEQPDFLWFLDSTTEKMSPSSTTSDTPVYEDY